MPQLNIYLLLHLLPAAAGPFFGVFFENFRHVLPKVFLEKLNKIMMLKKFMGESAFYFIFSTDAS